MIKIIQTFLLCIILPWAGAIDVVCGRKTSKTVLIGKGDSFSFKTQAGPTFQPNTKCVVKYKLKKSCPMMKFSCPLFDIENKKQNCKNPDRMTIVTNGKSKHYCQKKGPNLITRGTLQVKFWTDESGQAADTTTTTVTTTTTGGRKGPKESRQAAGAECVAQCFTDWLWEDKYTTNGYSYTYTGPGTGTKYWDYTYPSTYTTEYTTEGQDSSGISGVSELLRLLPRLRIPILEYVDVPGSWKSATISSDNILHDVTISYKGGRYNVLMEDVASIINIPQTLRNVKVFHHQGTKHFRIVRHGDKRMDGIKMRAKKVTKNPKKMTRHPHLISGKRTLVKKQKGKGNPNLISDKKMFVKKKIKLSHKVK